MLNPKPLLSYSIGVIQYGGLAFVMWWALVSPSGAQNKINLDVTTHLGDVRTFVEGDTVSFLLSLDRDAYVVLVYQNAAGQLIQLLPNKRQAQSYYKAGPFVPLPDAAAPFAFRIQAPFGREVLWVFAADVPLPPLPGRDLANGLKQLSGRIESIRRRLAAYPKSAYGETKLILQTRARR